VAEAPRAAPAHAIGYGEYGAGSPAGQIGGRGGPHQRGRNARRAGCAAAAFCAAAAGGAHLWARARRATTAVTWQRWTPTPRGGRASPAGLGESEPSAQKATTRRCNGFAAGMAATRHARTRGARIGGRLAAQARQLGYQAAGRGAAAPHLASSGGAVGPNAVRRTSPATRQRARPVQADAWCTPRRSARRERRNFLKKQGLEPRATPRGAHRIVPSTGRKSRRAPPGSMMLSASPRAAPAARRCRGGQIAGRAAHAAPRRRCSAAASSPAVTPELIALAHELADAAGEITRKARPVGAAELAAPCALTHRSVCYLRSTSARRFRWTSRPTRRP